MTAEDYIEAILQLSAAYTEEELEEMHIEVLKEIYNEL